MIKTTIIVKPNSCQEKVETLSDGSLRVCVNAPPIEGRANEEVIRLLAEHFSVAKSSVTILRGTKGKRKVVKIEGAVLREK